MANNVFCLFKVGDFVKFYWDKDLAYGTVVKIDLRTSVAHVKILHVDTVVSIGRWSLVFATEEEYAEQILKRVIKQGGA